MTNINGSHGFSNQESNLSGLVLKRFLQVAAIILVQGAILFISSGRLNWTMAWVYIGAYVGIAVVNAVVILPHNPELIAERGQIKENAKSWDKVLAPLVSLCGPVATLIVAGLDARFGWSLQPSLAIQFIALIFLVLGYGIFSWSMASNSFFSGVVRIQKDRSHSVVTSGPYRYVRHPGYMGLIMYSLATPLLLSSLWALVPAVLTAGIVVVRTVFEDKVLQKELDGYKDYAQQVRYRLLIGIW